MLSEEKLFNTWIPGFSERLRIRPGITGLSQCRGYKGYVESQKDVEIRYKLDMLYVNNFSVAFDVYILAYTVDFLFFTRKK